jgi:ABC-type tungstate transport system permease subunit
MAVRLLACALVAAMLAVVAAPAGADSSATVTVLGPADLIESALVQQVIAPQFRAAFGQYALKYAGAATTTTIANAENGTGGPSVLIARDPTAEAGFVAGGFSAGGPGAALFTSSLVLVGPTAAPAGVAIDGADNIAQAFSDIAKAGVAGHTTFVTRGGTTTATPATIVEHAVWALMNQSGPTPAGIVLCDVSAADGGGMSPINPAVQPTSGQACPDAGSVNAVDVPSWYTVNTGANAATHLTGANACGCYALTDRGVFDSLTFGGPTNPIPGLAIASAGSSVLQSTYHAYVINPAKPGETVNGAGALAFVGLLTSPAWQLLVGTYLNADPNGGPYQPDAVALPTTTPPAGAPATGSTPPVTAPAASPATTASFKKVSVTNGLVTITGTLSTATTTSGASVRLFALETGRVAKAKAHKAAATFKDEAKATIKAHSRSFTIRHRFKRGERYALQLEYADHGQTATRSSYRYVSVR